jgi:hypothetical protein
VRYANFMYASHIPAVCDLACDLEGYELESNQVRLVRIHRPDGISYEVDGQVCFRPIDQTQPEGKLVVMVTSPRCGAAETAVVTAKATIVAVKYDGTVGRGQGQQKRMAAIAQALVQAHSQHLPADGEVVVPYWTAKGRGGRAPVKALRRFDMSEVSHA